MGSVMGSCKLFEVSNFCAAWGVKFWEFFFRVRFSQKMEITRRLVFELQWKGLHGAYINCVFFVKHVARMFVHHTFRDPPRGPDIPG